MSKFNKPATRAAVSSPVTSEQTPTGRTFEGAPGFARDAKGELFLLAVANLVGEDTFYERAKNRDDRYTQLVRKVAVDDPDWTAAFLEWLRGEGNMRSASIVGAAEYVHARLDAAGARERRTHEAGQGPGTAVFGGDSLTYRATANRRVIDSVLQRADEPGEMLAYWASKYGRNLPKPVKRGVADAVARLYTERNLLKYDSASDGYRFGDVIDLVHPIAGSHSEAWTAWQGDLFAHALDRRHGRDNPIPERLGMLRARAELLALPVGERRAVLGDPQRLKDAGITWEALAGWLQGPMDAAAWSAVIPSMGIFALVRNLRNFDQAGVSDALAEQVIGKISDPAVVAKSRMLPFRFWAAYKHTSSLRWAHALDRALNASLGNVPALGGRTLVLVDRSPSMFPGYGYSTPNKSDIPLAEQAAVFGAAVALRAHDATLVEFGGTSKQLAVPKGGSVLRLIEQFGTSDGTDIPSAVKLHYKGHDRVIVVTDEQTRPCYLPSNMQAYGGMRETSIDELIPAHVPVYMWNMAGYKHGAMPSGSGQRHAFGGLSDAAFRMVPLLEARRDAKWPWEATQRG